MKQRIFVAIDLPQDVKQRIGETISQWQWLPIRWMEQKNWHVTLLAPKYLTDEELVSFLKELKKKELGSSFQINLSRVVLAPPGIPARMIWLEGGAPSEFLQLKQRLEPTLQGKHRSVSSSAKLHVTIARFQAGDMKELEVRTRVLGEIQFRFTVREVAVLKSSPTSEGAEYETLAVIPLSA